MREFVMPDSLVRRLYGGIRHPVMQLFSVSGFRLKIRRNDFSFWIKLSGVTNHFVTCDTTHPCGPLSRGDVRS